MAEVERRPGLVKELGVSHGNALSYTLLVLLGGEGPPVTLNLDEAAHRAKGYHDQMHICAIYKIYIYVIYKNT